MVHVVTVVKKSGGDEDVDEAVESREEVMQCEENARSEKPPSQVPTYCGVLDSLCRCLHEEAETEARDVNYDPSSRKGPTDLLEDHVLAAGDADVVQT